MKLSTEQIKSVTMGAARVKESDGKVEFFRFTEAQEALYLRESPHDFYKKTFTSAGIRLEFETDSSWIDLSMEVGAVSSNGFFGYDIYADGIFVGQLGGKLGADPLIQVFGHFDLGDGKKKVAIYFPWNATSRLVALELEEDATLSPVVKDVHMLIFGDSITQGYTTLEPAKSYASILTDKLNAEARNKGIGGEFFRGELASTKDEDIHPDIITVAYGTNDWSKQTKKDFHASTKAFYENLSAAYPDAKIFAITPIWRTNYEDQTKAVGNFFHVEEYIKEVTAPLPNVTVIPGFDLVPHDITLYWDYYLHPNKEGFVIYAENLYREISKHL